MTEVVWDRSLVIGPRQVARLGETNPVTGERDFLGWLPGYRLIVSWSGMTAAAEAYLSSPQPTNPQDMFAGDERSEGDAGRWKYGAYLVFPDDDGEGERLAAAALPDVCTVVLNDPAPVNPPENEVPL